MTTFDASTIRDRIIEFRRIPASELTPNAKNWRTHPQHQRDALRGLLSEIGIAGAVLAYHSERNNGALTLIDGHERQTVDVEWPTLITDLTDAEADLLLALFDPIGALAGTNAAVLHSLIDSVDPDSVVLDQLLLELAEDAHLSVTSDQTITRDVKRGVAPRVKVVVVVPDLTCIEAALDRTGDQNRGTALVTICQEYLDRHAAEG